MQVESDSDMCRECIGDVEGRIRRLEVVRGLDTDVEVEIEDLEEVKGKRRVEGQEEGADEDEAGECELEGQPIEKMKHTQCDVSRVCDPVVVKRRIRG